MQKFAENEPFLQFNYFYVNKVSDAICICKSTLPTDLYSVYTLIQICLSLYVSRSAHRTHNFTNPEYFVCLLSEYFLQITFYVNIKINTPKNANITHYIKEKKHFATP